MFAYAKPEQKQKQTSKSTVQKNEQKKTVTPPNITGIPETMKSRFEDMSGFSFDDVRAHYNSDKPAKMQVLAYTQGNQMHVAPEQERHLGNGMGHVVQGLFFEIGDRKITPDHIVAILKKDPKWDKLRNDYPDILTFIYRHSKALRFLEESDINYYFYAGDFIYEYQSYVTVPPTVGMDTTKFTKKDIKPQKPEELGKLHLAEVKGASMANKHRNHFVASGVDSDFVYLGWGGCMLLQKVGMHYRVVKHAITGADGYTEESIMGGYYSIRTAESAVTDGVSTCTVIVATNGDCSFISIMHLDSRVLIPPGYILSGMDRAFISKVEAGEEEEKKVEALMLYGIKKLRVYDRGMPSTYPTTSHDQIGLALNTKYPELIFETGVSDTPRLFDMTFRDNLPEKLKYYRDMYGKLSDELRSRISKSNFAPCVNKGTDHRRTHVENIFAGLLREHAKLLQMETFYNFAIYAKTMTRLRNDYITHLPASLKDFVSDEKMVQKYSAAFGDAVRALEQLDGCIHEFQTEFAKMMRTALPWILDEIKMPISYKEVLDVVIKSSRIIIGKEQLTSL